MRNKQFNRLLWIWSGARLKMKKIIHGFTLIELLVVMAIMATLVVVVMPQFISFNQSQGLQNAAATLQTSLRTAQNNATSGALGNQCSPAGSAAKWLVEFISVNSYRISSICLSEITPTPSPVFVNDILLPQDVTINSITFISGSDQCVIDNISNFTFAPAVSFDNISGGVTFDDRNNGCPVTSSTGEMIITLQSNSNSAEVKIEKGGAITVEAS